jgi:hypothetical protein
MGRKLSARSSLPALGFRRKSAFDKTAAKLVSTNDQNRGLAEAVGTVPASLP